jgi:hypothetical protein
LAVAFAAPAPFPSAIHIYAKDFVPTAKMRAGADRSCCLDANASRVQIWVLTLPASGDLIFLEARAYRQTSFSIVFGTNLIGRVDIKPQRFISHNHHLLHGSQCRNLSRLNSDGQIRGYCSSMPSAGRWKMYQGLQSGLRKTGGRGESDAQSHSYPRETRIWKWTLRTWNNALDAATLGQMDQPSYIAEKLFFSMSIDYRD